MIEYEDLRTVNERFNVDYMESFQRVLRSGWFVLGKEVESFENEFSAFLGAKHCIGVANGLDALTLSFCALELPADSEVLVASNTYIATILAIIHAGFKPVLVEPDIRTYNIDPDRLKDHLSSRTKVICVTHLYGKSCQMDQITAFADKHGLKIIEDCAQSHAATFNGKMTGTFGIAGCFSFYPTKNLGALGDAGAVVTNDDEFAERLKYWRNYGSRKKYVNKYLGYNSRLDEVQAAFLRIKLKSLNNITLHKRKLADIYLEQLPQDVVLPVVSKDCFDVFHIFAIRCQERDELKSYLLENFIKTEIHYPIPPHEQEALNAYNLGAFPIAEVIHATELSLPISYALTYDQVYAVCEAVKKFYQAA